MNRICVCAGLLLTLDSSGARAAGDLLSRAPFTFKQLINPYEDRDEAVRAGAKLYNRECGSCHGLSRNGKAPPLESQLIGSAAPGALFWVLRNGSLRAGMPSFAHLPEAQRWQIIAYLKSRHK